MNFLISCQIREQSFSNEIPEINHLLEEKVPGLKKDSLLLNEPQFHVSHKNSIEAINILKSI
jgi:hypothetical protein